MPGGPHHLLELGAQTLGVDEIELVGFVDRGFELAGRQSSTEVNQGQDGACNGNPTMNARLHFAQATPAMDPQSGHASGAVP
jgi:hypothetical protein